MANWVSAGCGVIANELAQAMEKRGQKLYGVVNRTPEKAVAFAEKYGVQKVFTSFQDVCADPAVDIIYISTPHNTHIHFLRKALAAGKHVLCEKSITLNSEELEEAVQLAKEHGVVLAEAMTIYHMPIYKELKKRMEQSRLRKLRGDLDQLIESDPKLRALRPHLKIDLVQEGLRIQIIDSQNRPMFRTGSADVEPYMRDILRAIAPVLNGIPNRISLSGHTDDFPYASGEKGYSNWELSADRANASRRELMVGGLDSGKVLRVVGMAATMRLSDRGPDDAVNRRISLLVLNKQAEQAILHENAESQNEPVSALEKPEVAPQVSVPTMPSAEPR